MADDAAADADDQRRQRFASGVSAETSSFSAPPLASDLASSWACVVGYIVLLLAVVHANKDRIIRSPLGIAYVALAWTLCVASAIALAPSQHGGRKVAPHGFGEAWFALGWSEDFAFFNFRINTPEKYTAILLYQVTRSFLHSLINDVFKPYMVVRVQGEHNVVRRRWNEVAMIIAAQSSVTVFGLFSEITDIYLFLKQIDFSLLTVLTLIVADGHMTVILSLAPPQPPQQHAAALCKATVHL